MAELQRIRQSVVDGDVDLARQLAQDLVTAGEDLLTALDQGFALGIREVGRLWEEGEFFLPELVQGAEAMKAAMGVLLPHMEAQTRQRARGRVVLGTVEGDLHDIGKSLVGTLLVAHGFEVEDLGVDVPVERFVARAREGRADIVAASALLTTTMAIQRELVKAVRAAGLSCAVLVGGAPTSARWAREVGAHHAEDALEAVVVATQLLSC